VSTLLRARVEADRAGLSLLTWRGALSEVRKKKK
jgi:hypothetical protein